MLMPIVTVARRLRKPLMPISPTSRIGQCQACRLLQNALWLGISLWHPVPLKTVLQVAKTPQYLIGQSVGVQRDGVENRDPSQRNDNPDADQNRQQNRLQFHSVSPRRRKTSSERGLPPCGAFAPAISEAIAPHGGKSGGYSVTCTSFQKAT